MYLRLDGKHFCGHVCKSPPSHQAFAWKPSMASWHHWSADQTGCESLGTVGVTACWAGQKGSWAASVCFSASCLAVVMLQMGFSDLVAGAMAPLQPRFLRYCFLAMHNDWRVAKVNAREGETNIETGNRSTGSDRSRWVCGTSGRILPWLFPLLSVSMSCPPGAWCFMSWPWYFLHMTVFLISPSLRELWHRCQQPPETAKSFCAIEMCSDCTSS